LYRGGKKKGGKTNVLKGAVVRPGGERKGGGTVLLARTSKKKGGIWKEGNERGGKMKGGREGVGL